MSDRITVEEVVVTRPDGYQYTAQLNEADQKTMKDNGFQIARGQTVEEPVEAETKKADPAKNKARTL